MIQFILKNAFKELKQKKSKIFKFRNLNKIIHFFR